MKRFLVCTFGVASRQCALLVGLLLLARTRTAFAKESDARRTMQKLVGAIFLVFGGYLGLRVKGLGCLASQGDSRERCLEAAGPKQACAHSPP